MYYAAISADWRFESKTIKSSKVRGDKDNPVSEGYICRKGMNIAYHQHNKDRVLFPLKKVGDGFQRVSWEQAISEISEKLKGILDQHGPRTLASLVGGGEFAFLSMRLSLFAWSGDSVHDITIPQPTRSLPAGIGRTA